MSNDQENENGGLLCFILRFHKICFKIETAIFLVIVAVGVAIGFHKPLTGFGIAGVMLFFTWIYFDIQKQQKLRRSQALKSNNSRDKES